MVFYVKPEPFVSSDFFNMRLSFIRLFGDQYILLNFLLNAKRIALVKH